MSLAWLTAPVSDDAPCGPDLEQTDDGPFIDYYYEAESRMPERYFTPGIKSKTDAFSPGTLFDRSSISHKDENEQITKLLKRSRDLRLLSLLARFMILAGRLKEFSHAVAGIADLLEAFPVEVHPRDPSDRRGALDELGSNVAVNFPLLYAEIGGPGEVSLRRYQVATKAADPREGELDLVPGKLVSELGAPSNRKAVEEAHTALNLVLSSMARIKSACLRHETNPFNPSLDLAKDTIVEMLNLIQLGRNDLTPWSEDAVSADEDVSDDTDNAAQDGEAETAAPTAATGPRTVTAQVVVTTIPNRAAAVQTIKAVETYFATHEPTAPALLLITQARLLVGKPLVEAIETLLPSQAANTKIDFGPETGFVLDMNRLKMLAGEAAGQAADTSNEDPGPMPEVTNRAEVTAHLSALEEFYRAREPASPIPVLLFRARTYLEKDFAAIVSEMVPLKVEENG